MGRITNLLEGKIPQEDIKRGNVRTDQEQKGVRSDVGKSKGLKTNTLVGWFSNKYNRADGWMLHALKPSEKKEFGSTNVFRSYTEGTDSTNIVKINLEKGTYAFLDNKEYEENSKIKFEKMSPYSNIKIEKSELAFKEFNIVW